MDIIFYNWSSILGTGFIGMIFAGIIAMAIIIVIIDNLLDN